MMKKKVPVAEIVGFSEYQVNVFCPYCRQIHSHGITPEHTNAIGLVTSHCKDIKADDPAREGYLIPNFDTYDKAKAVDMLQEGKENKKAARRNRLLSR